MTIVYVSLAVAFLAFVFLIYGACCIAGRE